MIDANAILFHKSRLKGAQGILSQRIGERDSYVQEQNRQGVIRDNAVAERDVHEAIGVLLQEVADTARESAKLFLENIVTSALQYVSGSGYEFKIEFDVKNKRPHADMYVVEHINGETSMQKPEDACGGGFVDIITTALRLGYLEILNNPVIRGPVILDEPGKMISEQASVRYGDFVRDMISSYNRQCIMITHNNALMSVADNAILVEKHGGESVILNPSVAAVIDREVAGLDEAIGGLNLEDI